jgi:hypothetical protein
VNEGAAYGLPFLYALLWMALVLASPRSAPSARLRERVGVRGLLCSFAYGTACAERFVSRLTREFLLSVATKETKRACPYLGPALRSGSPPYVVAPGAGLRAIHGPIPLRGSRPLRPLTQRLRSACAQGAVDQDHKPRRGACAPWRWGRAAIRFSLELLVVVAGHNSRPREHHPFLPVQPLTIPPLRFF